jgi:hypothetical protein
MEPRFGYDFSGVRVHTDARAAESARAVDARAYTVGSNVVFGTGQYAPTNEAGKSLLAHELAHVVQQEAGLARAMPHRFIQRQPSTAGQTIPDWRQVYQQCRQQVFQGRSQLAWGTRRIPSLEAVNLILQVTGTGADGYGPEDLATVWAIETNFVTHPANHENANGSIDIGPVQINYEAHSPGISESRQRTIFGTNVGAGETFNGSPLANLTYGWQYLRRRGHAGYNPGSRARAAAVAALLSELSRFFACLIGARTVTFEAEEVTVPQPRR